MVQINKKWFQEHLFHWKLFGKKNQEVIKFDFLFGHDRDQTFLLALLWGAFLGCAPTQDLRGVTFQVDFDLTYCHLSSDLRRGRRRVWPFQLTSATWQFDLSSSTVLKRNCKTLTIWASHMFLSRYLGRFQKKDRVTKIALYISFDPSDFLSWVYNTFSFFFLSVPLPFIHWTQWKVGTRATTHELLPKNFKSHT